MLKKFYRTLKAEALLKDVTAIVEEVNDLAWPPAATLVAINGVAVEHSDEVEVTDGLFMIQAQDVDDCEYIEGLLRQKFYLLSEPQ